jgi:hypothetical protein
MCVAFVIMQRWEIGYIYLWLYFIQETRNFKWLWCWVILRINIPSTNRHNSASFFWGCVSHCNNNNRHSYWNGGNHMANHYHHHSFFLDYYSYQVSKKLALFFTKPIINLYQNNRCMCIYLFLNLGLLRMTPNQSINLLWR